MSSTTRFVTVDTTANPWHLPAQTEALLVTKGTLLVNVKDYGAKGDSTTDDRAAIQAAHDALASGGRLFFPPGQYYITGTINISKQITIEGASRGELGSLGGGVYILAKLGSVSAFSVSVGAVTFRQLTFLGYGVSYAQSVSGQGVAITFTAGDRHVVERCTFQIWYKALWFQNCANWIVRDNYFDAPAKYHIHIQNVALPDRGDQVVSGNSFFSTGSFSCDSIIRQESGGGTKYSDNKFIATTAARCIDVAIADGVGTSILLVNNNSFESFTVSAIRLTQSGSTFTGTFYKSVINGNQFTVRCTGAAIDVAGLGVNSACIRTTVITANQMDGLKSNANPFVSIVNARNVHIAANQFTTSATGIVVAASAQDVRVDPSNQFQDVDVLVSGASTNDTQTSVLEPRLVARRAAIYHDPSTKANGSISAGLVLDSGATVINNVGSWPVSYSGGRIVHAPTTVGATSAGYLMVQAPAGSLVRRVAAYVAWPANALGAAAFVVPSAFWNQSAGTLPAAGFHVTMYGNGLWTAGVWNPAAGNVGRISEILYPGALATAVTLSVSNGSGTQVTSSLSVATMTAASLQTALTALSNVGAGKVTVISNLGGSFGITWSTLLTATTMTISAQTGSGATIIEVGTGVLNYADNNSNGRYGSVWDSQLHLIDIWLYPEVNQALIYFPDGSNSGLITHPGIGLLTGSGYAVFELFENNISASDVPASFGKFWVDNAQQQADAFAPNKPDVLTLITAGQRSITEYSGAGTYTGTIPPGCKGVSVTAISPGGGGGSGRQGAAASLRCAGGSGGTGGVIQDQFIPISACGTGGYTVIIGAPGTGGAAVSAADTNGNAGTGGGVCTVTLPTAFLRSLAGGGGGGGTNAAGGTNGGAGAPLAVAGVTGSSTGLVGTNGSTNYTGSCGGSASGGGITAANVAAGGGVGGAAGVWTSATVGGAAGVVDSTAPGGGSAALAGRPGDGAGGGAASITTAAQAGATALGYGAGGGGGGASLDGFNSGAGGAGGPGYVRITIVKA